MTAAIGFGVIAACVLFSAIFVVRALNLVHAVLWLGVTLVGTAALYAMLGASFLAAVQVLLYVGGVVTLMIFGVMLTRRHDGLVVHAERFSPSRGVFAAGAVFGIIAAAVGKSELPAGAGDAGVPIPELAKGLLTTHILAFEALSLLLLGAIVGAIVIARRRDAGAPPATTVARKPRPLEPATSSPEEERP